MIRWGRLRAYAQRFTPDADAVDGGATESEWVAISSSGSAPPWIENGRLAHLDGKGTLWTDDYSNVLSVLKF